MVKKPKTDENRWTKLSHIDNFRHKNWQRFLTLVQNWKSSRHLAKKIPLFCLHSLPPLKMSKSHSKSHKCTQYFRNGSEWFAKWRREKRALTVVSGKAT